MPIPFYIQTFQYLHHQRVHQYDPKQGRDEGQGHGRHLQRGANGRKRQGNPHGADHHRRQNQRQGGPAFHKGDFILFRS